jgi:hypothetical protein
MARTHNLRNTGLQQIPYISYSVNVETEGFLRWCITSITGLNLGCLHPVARVISYDMGFNPSTQR